MDTDEDGLPDGRELAHFDDPVSADPNADGTALSDLIGEAGEDDERGFHRLTISVE